MNEPPVKAWQPLTFGGVARYGQDWLGRLFVTCLVVSIITAAAVLWTVGRAWVPAVEDAITRLPVGAEIRGGKLTAPQPARLAENSFLSFYLDPTSAPSPASLSDIHITLASSEIRFRSLFGVTSIPYRPEWTIPLNSAELEPKWGAWKPAVMAYLFFGTILWLFLSWIGLAVVYGPFVRVFAGFLGRALTLWGAWKVSVAALLPPAILMTVGFGLYGLGQIRLAELLFTWGLHFVVGWIFLIGATFRLPAKKAHEKKKAANPFRSSDDEEEDQEDKDGRKNPFKARGKKGRGGLPSS